VHAVHAPERTDTHRLTFALFHLYHITTHSSTISACKQRPTRTAANSESNRQRLYQLLDIMRREFVFLLVLRRDARARRLTGLSACAASAGGTGPSATGPTGRT
jgi:hypothetical protein